MVLFLGGTMTFKRISSRNNWFPPRTWRAAGWSAALTLGLAVAPADAVFAWARPAIFAVVALWEWVSFTAAGSSAWNGAAGGWAAILRRYTDWAGAACEKRPEGLARHPLDPGTMRHARQASKCWLLPARPVAHASGPWFSSVRSPSSAIQASARSVVALAPCPSMRGVYVRADPRAHIARRSNA
jgi:hypothetical protein